MPSPIQPLPLEELDYSQLLVRQLVQHLEIRLKRPMMLFGISAPNPSPPLNAGPGGAPLETHGEWCKCWMCTHTREAQKAQEHGPESFEPRVEDGVIVRGPQS